MGSMTRGPLPAHVYWRRRLVVLALPVLLVLLLARVLGGGSDGSDGAGGSDDAMTLQAGDETPSAGESSPVAEPDVSGGTGGTGGTGDGAAGKGDRSGKDRSGKAAPKATEPAEPQGECVNSDVVATPAVEDAVAGPTGVTISVELTTRLSPACTWEVSPRNLALRITSGDDQIWESAQCRASIPTQEVVVRRDEATVVEVPWAARRSDDDTCARFNAWAETGWYHVAAAATGGEPSEVQFELSAPPRAVVTKTVEPTPR